MVTFFVKDLVALFTIVDPVGLAPVVLALTAGMSPAERTLVIFRPTIIASRHSQPGDERNVGLCSCTAHYSVDCGNASQRTDQGNESDRRNDHSHTRPA